MNEQVNKILELVNSGDPASKEVGLAMITFLYEEMLEMDLVQEKSYKVHWGWRARNKWNTGYSISVFKKWNNEEVRMPVFDQDIQVHASVLTIEEI